MRGRKPMGFPWIAGNTSDQVSRAMNKIVRMLDPETIKGQQGKSLASMPKGRKGVSESVWNLENVSYGRIEHHDR